MGQDSTLLELVKQIADRMRRTETRVTKIANHIGVDAGGDVPRWSDGRINVPSPMCSLKDCMAVVPRDWPSDEYVEVYVKNTAGRDDYMMAFTTG